MPLAAESPTRGITPEYDVRGGIDPDDEQRRPSAGIDTDDQGSVYAKEYDRRHRREHRTPGEVLDGETAQSVPQRRPDPPAQE